MTIPAPRSVDGILSRLDQFEPVTPAQDLWSAFSSPRDWPSLFRVLAIAADLPNLESSLRLGETKSLWPALYQQTTRLLLAQRMVAHPQILPGSTEIPAIPATETDRASEILREEQCVHVEELLARRSERSDLESAVASFAAESSRHWGPVRAQQAPDLHRCADRIVQSSRFRDLTGYVASRDEYSLTLSLQDIDQAGIGWHQDLYWPREWVKEDVFAVLYALGNDRPTQGGAFLLYSSHSNRLSHTFRKQHDCTILWNGRSTPDRPFHAVSGYLGDQRSRPLLILQCLRRAP